MNRAHLDLKSVSARSSCTSARSSTSDYEDDNDVDTTDDAIDEVDEVSSIAMADLRSIARCMIFAGYAKECMNRAHSEMKINVQTSWQNDDVWVWVRLKLEV
jgi:exocyst complex protein 7